MRDGVGCGGGAAERFALRLYRPRLPNLKGKMVKLWVMTDNSRIIRFATCDLLLQFAIVGRPNPLDNELGRPIIAVAASAATHDGEWSLRICDSFLKKLPFSVC